jgi:hypothetical protein
MKMPSKTSSQRFWLGPVGPKDDFGNDIKDEMIDGRTKQGPWALMSPASWKTKGIGRFGTGFGQRYRKLGDGRWLKVEG